MNLLDKLAHYFGCLYAELRDAWRTRRSVGWVPVQAKVRAVSADSSGLLSEVQVQFTYSYHGKVYAGKAERATLFSPRKIQAQFVAGDECTAYVDPDSPARAHLRSETRWAEPIVVGLIVLCNLALLVWGLVRRFLPHETG